MLAVVISRPGGPDVLEMQARPVPEPSRGQILVRVRASALNRADISQRLGKYPAPAGSPPDIPGLEYAGEVVACGADATLWKQGDRVMGIIGGGGHAEYVTVHERETMPVPANLTWEEAGAIPEVFLTAYDALYERLEVVTGENLLIHAVGSGVGTAALQMASITGVTSIGTSRSPAKLERAAGLGLVHAIDASRIGWERSVSDLTGKAGVHAVLDLVGGSYFEANLGLLATRGRMVVVGLTSGAKSEIDLGMVLTKRLQIRGTVLRSRPLEEKIALTRRFAAHMLPFFESLRLRPVVDRVLSFEDVGAAHAEMEASTNFGKIVLRW